MIKIRRAKWKCQYDLFAVFVNIYFLTDTKYKKFMNLKLNDTVFIWWIFARKIAQIEK